MRHNEQGVCDRVDDINVILPVVVHYFRRSENLWIFFLTPPESLL